MDACAQLCAWVHGVERSVDLRDALELFTPFAAVRDGRIVAYTYAVYRGHLAWGVARTEEDMRARLTGVAAALAEPLAFLLPTRKYQEPRGCYVPSGIY